MKISKDVIEAVRIAAKDKDGHKEISCKELFKLAEELDAKHRLLGKICDQEHIRIVSCQLGCFQ